MLVDGVLETPARSSMHKINTIPMQPTSHFLFITTPFCEIHLIYWQRSKGTPQTQRAQDTPQSIRRYTYLLKSGRDLLLSLRPSLQTVMPRPHLLAACTIFISYLGAGSTWTKRFETMINDNNTQAMHFAPQFLLCDKSEVFVPEPDVFKIPL